MGPVQVWTRSDPKVRSLKHLALDPLTEVRANHALAWTLGPPCGVRKVQDWTLDNLGRSAINQRPSASQAL